MASFWSEYLKNKVLDHMRGIATWTPGTHSHFALMSVAPTPLGGGTPAPTISRFMIQNSSLDWNAASGAVSTNKVLWTFTTAAVSDIGVIVGIAEYDASTGGNLLTYGDLTTPKTLLTGMAFSVAAGAGKFTYVDDTAP